MDDWSYGTAFADLLRSELDNGRPILMRGDEGVTDLDKHHFVIDGYDASDNDWFWFNFGWGYWNTETYNTSRHYLGDISPGPHGPYDALQMVIVGISPTVAADANIYDVAYSSVWDIRLEDAQQSIELPASGKSLTVENGGDLTLIAGSSIVINPGFNAKLGSTFKAQINPDYLTDINISVQGYTSSFSPGSNEELCYNVSNANSWEFEAYNMGGGAVFQSAGKIDSSPCCVWDGSGSSVTGYYTCTIRFKNNYGRILEHSYQVWVQY